MNPKVSVIIPTYNSEDYIAQALESVFNQTYHNFEIILVDDASTDSTVQIARSFRDKRLKILKNSQNRGVSHGRNRGISQAKGNWIALLDSDDWYAPQRLEKLLQVAEQHSADMVADNQFFVRDGEQYPWSNLLYESKQDILSVELVDAARFVISDRPSAIDNRQTWSFGYTKPLLRREFLIKNNIQYNEAIKVGEDFILYLECLRHQARFYLVPQAYYYYRTRTVSLSTRTPTEYLSESCEITQSFIRKEESSPTNLELLEALSQNLIIFKKKLEYYRTVESIKHRKIGNIVKQMLVHPYILLYFGNKLISVLENKTLSLLERGNTDQAKFSLSFDIKSRMNNTVNS